jgi:hypothetical protein
MVENHVKRTERSAEILCNSRQLNLNLEYLPITKTIYMKRALPLVLFVLLCWSCKDTKTEIKEAPPVQVKSVAIADPMTLKMDELKKTPTLGLDELAAYLPSSLLKLKRTNLSMTSSMGYSVAHADYIKNNKTDIRVNIIDCAGESGAAIYASSYAAKLKNNVENESGYTKSTEINGMQVMKNFEKSTNATTITYMANDRVMVEISTRNIAPEDVAEAMKQIRVN